MASFTDTSESVLQRAAIPPLPVCRISVDKYEEMIRAGIITPEDRIELIDGWLVDKMTQNAPHVFVSEQVRDALYEAVPDGWCVYAQKPVRLRTSMPEPDAMVIRGRRQQYLSQVPQAKDVSLVLEVADASLWRDKELKKPLYAQAGIPVYWLVNLIDKRIEVYAQPSGSDEKADYQERRDFGPSDEIPLVLDGRQIANIPARDLLP